jgi:hypothetical protein
MGDRLKRFEANPPARVAFGRFEDAADLLTFEKRRQRKAKAKRPRQPEDRLVR